MNTNLTTDSKEKLQTIVDYWNENCVSDEAEYNEDTAAVTLLSLMIDKEFDRITRTKRHALMSGCTNLKQVEAQRAELIRQGRMRPWD